MKLVHLRKISTIAADLSKDKPDLAAALKVAFDVAAPRLKECKFGGLEAGAGPPTGRQSQQWRASGILRLTGKLLDGVRGFVAVLRVIAGVLLIGERYAQFRATSWRAISSTPRSIWAKKSMLFLHGRLRFPRQRRGRLVRAAAPDRRHRRVSCLPRQRTSGAAVRAGPDRHGAAHHRGVRLAGYSRPLPVRPAQPSADILHGTSPRHWCRSGSRSWRCWW